MKKILFLQNKGKSYGGVWQVNKLVGEELIKNNYDVVVASIRNNVTDIVLEHDPKLKLLTINEKELWHFTSGIDIINKLKEKHLIQATKMIKDRFINSITINRDIKKLHQFIYEYNPDYIVTSHYQLLDMIPKKYLSRTIHEQHSSFKDVNSHKKTINTLLKYKDKITYLWLTKATMEAAQKIGLLNSYFIYNAVRFKSDEIADVCNNKKLVTIARLNDQKRIDIMIKIMNNIFSNKKYNDWSFEIYGSGDKYDYLKELITNKQQIKLMGLTNDPKEVLHKSSINLNTSKMEGFAMSILEANECGIPTVTLNFGESVYESVIDNKTGYIIENDNVKLFQEKIEYLMNNSQELKKLSENCREFSKKFYIENIIKKWIKLFEMIDK